MGTGYYGDGRGNAVAVLPVGESLNPANPDRSHYAFGDGLVGYTLFKVSEPRTRPTRVITSYGPVSGWQIGTTIHLQHDQTMAYMGEYRIVGIVSWDDDESAGQVPDIKIKWQVLK